MEATNYMLTLISNMEVIETTDENNSFVVTSSIDIDVMKRNIWFGYFKTRKQAENWIKRIKKLCNV